MERPKGNLKHSNHIQHETGHGGKTHFKEYWIREWDEKGYKLDEHIGDLEQAIQRACDLGYFDDATKLEKFRSSAK